MKNKETRQEVHPEARLEIIRGIYAEAETQAASIVEEARKAADLRIQAAENQAARIKAEAEEKSRSRIDAVEREAATRLVAGKRRIRLKMMEKIYHRIISHCTREIGKLIGTEEYDRILEDWITQAAEGLRAESALVNCSAPEREAVGRVLKRAEDRASAETGRHMSLSLSGDPPLPRQGVTVTSSDGRTAFNNQVESRIFRLQSEIRKLVHDRLFART